jgi:hypothetical protein
LVCQRASVCVLRRGQRGSNKRKESHHVCGVKQGEVLVSFVGIYLVLVRPTELEYPEFAVQVAHLQNSRIMPPGRIWP